MFNKPSFVVNDQTGKVKAIGTCVITGKSYQTAEFPASALNDYNSGAYIQDALWMLTSEDREFILSGMSPEGWVIAFGDEEEDY